MGMLVRRARRATPARRARTGSRQGRGSPARTGRPASRRPRSARTRPTRPTRAFAATPGRTTRWIAATSSTRRSTAPSSWRRRSPTERSRRLPAIAGRTTATRRMTTTAGVTGRMHGYFLVKVSCRRRQFRPRGQVHGKVLRRRTFSANFGTSNYDVPVFEMHISSPGHGTWKNASENRGGNQGNIN